MEFKFPSFTLLFTFFLFLFMLIKKGRQSKTKALVTQLPPGPWKLPLIGSMHHMIGALPHRRLSQLAKQYGPVMLLKLGQVDLVVITSPEAASEVMKTHDVNFASRPKLIAPTIVTYDCSGIVFSPYGSYWRQLRKICVLELLSARRVKMFSSLREEEFSDLVRYIYTTNNSVPINLTEKLLSMINTMTSRAAFGKGCKHGERFIRAAKEAIALASGFNAADLYPSLGFIDVVSGMRFKLERIHREMDEILADILEEHEKKATAKKSSQNEAEEDLLDVLLKHKDHGDLEIPLTMDNVKAVILDIFIGGTETSSSIIEWTMAELMKNPNIMEKVQAEVRQVLKEKNKVGDNDVGELHYLKLVIKETLRLHPPIPLLVPRLCRETCEVGGYRIPAGSRVIVNSWSLARDPKYWDDAESFKPERFEGSSVDFKGTSFEYLPFGAGRRTCPGMVFGLANVEPPLAQLLFHFNWELPDGIEPKDLDMTESFGATVGRKLDLCLLATPHIPLPTI